MWKNITIPILILLVLGLIYFNRNKNLNLSRQATAIEAYKDTVHNFKSKFGSQAGYISTIESDKSSLLALLNIQKDKNKDLINLLDSNKNVVNATDVQTKTKYVYVSNKDTTKYKGVKFTTNIHTDWLDEVISVDSNKLSRNLEYRDAYLFHMDKKSNGLFKGSTLTTYVEPKNPDTKVTGLTSISTVVDQRKVRFGFFAGPAVNINNKGNLSTGLSIGAGITF